MIFILKKYQININCKREYARTQFIKDGQKLFTGKSIIICCFYSKKYIMQDSLSSLDLQQQPKSEVKKKKEPKVLPMRDYIPKYKTQSYEVLKAVIAVGGIEKPVTHNQVNDYFQETKGRRVKLRSEVRAKLISFGYIDSDEKHFYMKSTEKGRELIEKTERKQKERIEKNLPPSPKRKRHKKPKPIKTEREKTLEQEQKEKQKLMKRYVNEEYPRHNITSKDRVASCKGADSIKLLINQNSFSSALEKNLLLERISTLTSTDNHLSQLEIGDFAWVLGSKMLDYLILRIKMEQFDPEEFKFRCLRAKASGCDYVGVIFQFPTQSQKIDKGRVMVRTPQINEIIAATRIYGLKVVVTKGFDESMAFLKKITWSIAKKVRNLPSTGAIINHFGFVQRFNICNRYTRYTKLQRMTIKCMNCFGFNKNVLIKFARKYPTLRLIHDKLKRFKGNDHKKKLILHFLRKENPNELAVNLFIDILFSESYEAKLEQNQEQLDDNDSSELNESGASLFSESDESQDIDNNH